MNIPGLTPPSDFPAAGARISALWVRAAVALVGIGLTLVAYGANGWLALGILFSLIAAWDPKTMLAWVLLLFLAGGELTRSASVNWHFLVLLAGLHLLHLMAMFTLELPWRSWASLAVFAAPLTRFVAIQVPVQIVAIMALLLLGPNSDGHSPLSAAAIAVIGVCALLGLAVVLLRPRAEQDRRFTQSG